MFGFKSGNVIECENNIYNSYFHAAETLDRMDNELSSLYHVSSDNKGKMSERFALFCQFSMLQIGLQDNGFLQSEYEFLNKFSKKVGINVLDVYNSVGTLNFPLKWKDFKLDLPEDALGAILEDIKREVIQVTENLIKRISLYQLMKYGKREIPLSQQGTNDLRLIFCEEISSVMDDFISILANYSGVDDDLAGSETRKMQEIASNDFAIRLLDQLTDIEAIKLD